MPAILANHARDGGTFVVRASFFDEDSEAVTPSSVTWTLTDAQGAVINNRENVVATTGLFVDILLSGDDLLFSDGRRRILTLYALYDSTLGADLIIRDQVDFLIDDLLSIS